MSHSSQLLIDMGNTAVKWKLSGEPASVMKRAIYPQNLDETFFLALWQGLEISEVIVSCVASDDDWQACEQALKKLWHIPVKRISTQKQASGIHIAYDNPAALGVDRFCAMIAAFKQVEKAVMVVDCGSAITIDIIQATGRHDGGYILPGIQAMKKSLRQETAARDIEMTGSRISLLPGSSTRACVEAGIYHAAVSLIEAVYREQVKLHGQLQCIMTGGDAEPVQELLNFEARLVVDLVLGGLEILADEKENQ